MTESRMAFAEHGACAGHDQQTFYPEVLNITADHLAAANVYCCACLVRTECLRWALEHEDDGIWAATSPKQRNSMRKSLRIQRRPPFVDGIEVGLVPPPEELEDGVRSARDIAAALGCSSRTIVRNRVAGRNAS